jgi:hypothetical protein
MTWTRPRTCPRSPSFYARAPYCDLYCWVVSLSTLEKRQSTSLFLHASTSSTTFFKVGFYLFTLFRAHVLTRDRPPALPPRSLHPQTPPPTRFCWPCWPWGVRAHCVGSRLQGMPRSQGATGPCSRSSGLRQSWRVHNRLRRRHDWPRRHCT